MLDLLCTDAFKGYHPLHKEFLHGAVDCGKGQYVIGAIHMNTIEGFWSIFKRGVVGTFHKVSAKYRRCMLQSSSSGTTIATTKIIYGETIKGC